MGGLDASGKTLILYRIKLGELIEVHPTIGFNNEKINVGDIQLDLWEAGGGCMVRPLFKHYF